METDDSNRPWPAGDNIMPKMIKMLEEMIELNEDITAKAWPGGILSWLTHSPLPATRLAPHCSS